MNGYGEFYWKDGKKYFGFYDNDKKNGFGIFYWPKEKFYIGFWKDGKQMELLNLLKVIILNMVFGLMEKKKSALIILMNLKMLWKIKKNNLLDFLKWILEILKIFLRLMIKFI